MFRELARKKQQLPQEECIALLQKERRGVLSVLGDDGYPYGMPMNHYYNEQDGCIYFHCGRNGHRMDALRRCEKVSFCVYNGGERAPDEWALCVKSVIVFGRVEIVEEPTAIREITMALSLKFTQDEEYIRQEIEQYAKETLLLRLLPENMCGKTVKES